MTGDTLTILAFARYGPLGSSSRVRLDQFLPALAADGITVRRRALVSDAMLRAQYAGQSRGLAALARAYVRRLTDALRDRDVDLVWVEKELAPWLPAWAERPLLAGRRYVLDFDDAVFHNYDTHPSALVRALWGRKIDILIRGAALVVVGNAYLEARARAAGARHIERLPSVVDAEAYGPPGAAAPLPEGPFTIGWIGSPGSEPALEEIAGVLADEAARPDTRVVLIGASEGALPGIPHETWAWSEATEVAAMQRFHVGIMPLADSPWERGKCGYKLIQCLAAGRPVVASPVGVNADLVTPEVGRLAATPAEWHAAFAELRADPALALRRGTAGRALVAGTFSRDVVAPQLAALLRRAAGRP